MVARWPLRRGATAAEVADPVYDIDATVVRIHRQFDTQFRTQ